MRSVGIRAFIKQLESLVDEVERGTTIIITKGGRKFARMEPIERKRRTKRPGR